MGGTRGGRPHLPAMIRLALNARLSDSHGVFQINMDAGDKDTIANETGIYHG
jgi:hypothetical protein